MIKIILENNIPVKLELVSKGTLPKNPNEVVIDFSLLPKDFIRKFDTYVFNGRKFIKNLSDNNDRILVDPVFSYDDSLISIISDDPIIEPDLPATSLNFTVDVVSTNNLTCTILMFVSDNAEFTMDWGNGTVQNIQSGNGDGTGRFMFLSSYPTVGTYSCILDGDLSKIKMFVIGSGDSSDGGSYVANINDISDLTSLEVLGIDGNYSNGNGNIALDISTISSSNLISCILMGTHVTGNLSNIPSSVTELVLSNTSIIGSTDNLSGNIFVNPNGFDITNNYGLEWSSPTPSNNGTCYLLNNSYNGEYITGDIAILIPNCTKEITIGNANMSYSTCTVPAVYGTMYSALVNCGLSSSELDRLFIDFSESIVSGPGLLATKNSLPTNLNEVRTAASDAALATLSAAGFTVTRD